MHDVFISYSSHDKAIADAVCAGLERRGIRCWIAPRDILAGVEWGQAIVSAITSARVMVLLLSDNANKSAQIPKEVDRAVNKGVAVLPLRIQDVQPTGALEYYLGPAHWLDAITPPMQGHIDRLAQNVQALLSRPAQPIGASGPGAARQPSGPGRQPAGVRPPPPPPRQSAGPQAAYQAPQAAYQAPAGGSSYGGPVNYAAPLPPQEATPDGVRVLLYLVAAIVPIVGIVMFFVYNAKPQPAERKLGQTLLIIGIASFVVWSLMGCMCLAAAADSSSGY